MNLDIATMVQKVGLRLGLHVTSSPIGSTDLQVRQLVELFNEEVSELGTTYRWQVLTQEATFTTIADEDQGAFCGGILPDAAQYHYIISDTMWDRTARQPIPGPKSSFDWQSRKAVQYTSGPYPTYRIRANHLLMLPIPAAGNEVYFEYATKKFVYDPNTDTYGPTFTANESVPVLDSDLIMAGVRWRWKMAHDLQYAEEKRTYDLRAATMSARDAGREVLSLSGGNQPFTGLKRAGDLTTTEIT